MVADGHRPGAEGLIGREQHARVTQERSAAVGVGLLEVNNSARVIGEVETAGTGQRIGEDDVVGDGYVPTQFQRAAGEDVIRLSHVKLRVRREGQAGGRQRHCAVHVGEPKIGVAVRVVAKVHAAENIRPVLRRHGPISTASVHDEVIRRAAAVPKLRALDFVVEVVEHDVVAAKSVAGDMIAMIGNPRRPALAPQ